MMFVRHTAVIDVVGLRTNHQLRTNRHQATSKFRRLNHFYDIHDSGSTVYFLHAYDYSPDDPMICLCLAIASIGRAMQRQSDNRHHLVTQGMAFLSKYRELRKEEVNAIGEVEFNFGRTFPSHQLGKQRESNIFKAIHCHTTLFLRRKTL